MSYSLHSRLAAGEEGCYTSTRKESAMLAPLEVSVYLNNALKAKHVMAEVDSDTPLPEVIKEMPEQVSGRFVGLDEPVTLEIASAWKQTMMLNATEVLYTFKFDAASGKFSARRR
jgi:hypothetical protein